MDLRYIEHIGVKGIVTVSQEDGVRGTKIFDERYTTSDSYFSLSYRDSNSGVEESLESGSDNSEVLE